MSADILITNAAVRTMDGTLPIAEAVAIKGNRITFVGTVTDALAHTGPNTRVVDAAGATVLPGFVEAHAHLMMGAESLNELDLMHIDGREALSDALLAYAAERPDAELLFGRSANYSILGEGTRPTRHDIDQIIADRPVFIRSGDYHNAWVNTAALEKAGVMNGHDVGPGSEIVLDNDGIATGELREGEAMMYVLGRLTDLGRSGIGVDPQNVTPAEMAADIALTKQGLDYCAAHGITTIQNMDGKFHPCEVLRAIEDAGDLNCRVEMPFLLEPSEPDENMALASEMAAKYCSDKLWSGRVKLFMDGVLDAWTAVVIDGYADKPEEFGTPLFTAERFNMLSIDADKRGLQISVHAIGDGAVRMVLDGYQAAAEANGPRDGRHRIEHIEMLHPDDMRRFAELGVIASMQANHPPGCGPFPAEPTIHMIGEARWETAYAWRMIKDTGAKVVFGTDWPVAPVDPLLAIKQALSRQPWTPDCPDQRLTMDEALAAYTSVGAYTCFKEDAFGSIEAGKLADIVVLDGPLPDDPTADWPKVRMTICDGVVSYEVD
ncbi:MAG: amidohydrolase [Pikeienuella sp.]